MKWIFELAALKKAKSLLEMSESGCVVILANVDGIVTDCSNNTSRVFQYERSDLIGLPIATIMPDRYAKVHGKYLERSRFREASNSSPVAKQGIPVPAEELNEMTFPMKTRNSVGSYLLDHQYTNNQQPQKTSNANANSNTSGSASVKYASRQGLAGSLTSQLSFGSVMRELEGKRKDGTVFPLRIQMNSVELGVHSFYYAFLWEGAMLSSAVPDLLSSNLPDTSSFSDMALLVSIPSDGKAHDNDNENENERQRLTDRDYSSVATSPRIQDQVTSFMHDYTMELLYSTRMKLQPSLYDVTFHPNHTHEHLQLKYSGHAVCKQQKGLSRSARLRLPVCGPRLVLRGGVYVEFEVMLKKGEGGICVGLGHSTQVLHQTVGVPPGSLGFYSNGSIVRDGVWQVTGGITYQQGDVISLCCSEDVNQSGQLIVTAYCNGSQKATVTYQQPSSSSPSLHSNDCDEGEGEGEGEGESESELFPFVSLYDAGDCVLARVNRQDLLFTPLMEELQLVPLDEALFGSVAEADAAASMSPTRSQASDEGVEGRERWEGAKMPGADWTPSLSDIFGKMAPIEDNVSEKGSTPAPHLEGAVIEMSGDRDRIFD